jgi:tRNA (guanine37-N1)-methyltransferase
VWCGIVTLFPEMLQALTGFGITRRAVENGLLQIHCWNPRDFAEDKHQTVDDRPYGGGPGMVMQVNPLRYAIQAAKRAAGGPAKVISLSPQGKRIDQTVIREAAQRERFIFVAGRYEGIDERLLALEIEEEWSIGDYVLSGGELAAMVAIDAMTRWLPGALGHEESASSDSFVEGLLDCPHYTRPEVVDGLMVPEVLLTGNHEHIRKWRLKQKLGRTWLRRRELLEKLVLNKECQALLQEFIQENKVEKLESKRGVEHE